MRLWPVRSEAHHEEHRARFGGALTAAQSSGLLSTALSHERAAEALAPFTTKLATADGGEEAAGPGAARLVATISSNLRKLEAALSAGSWSGKSLEQAMSVQDAAVSDGALDLSLEQAGRLAAQVRAFATATATAVAGLRNQAGIKSLDQLLAVSSILGLAATCLDTVRELRGSGLDRRARKAALANVRARLVELSTSNISDPALVATQLRRAAEAYVAARTAVTQLDGGILDTMTVAAIRREGLARGYALRGNATRAVLIAEFLTAQAAAAGAGAGAGGP